MLKKLLSVARFVINTYSHPVQGSLDLPSAESEVFGVANVFGWAYSPVGEITSVRVYFDDVRVGDAVYGIPRMDVPQLLKNIPVAKVGFSFDLLLPLVDFPQEHEITVETTDTGGHALWLSRKFKVVPVTSEPQVESEAPVVTAPDLEGENDALTERPSEYDLWIERNEPLPAELIQQCKEASRLHYRPLFSVVMPVFNPPAAILKAAIQSVQNQTYDRWELCITDGGSTNPEVLQVLREAENFNTAVKVRFLENNLGISGNSNAAIALASGEFIVLLDHDDTISPDALYENALLLNRHPEADMIYSDEDKLDLDGVRSSPVFKPDWSPDLMRSMMYTCHLGVYRTELVRRLGGFNSTYDGAQDYDLVLRVTEKTKNIFHIPKILYHWRAIEGSAALNSGQKPEAYALQPRLVAEHCQRIGWRCEVTTPTSYHTMRCRPVLNNTPFVSIIISAGEQAMVVSRCISNILERSTYESYEFIVVADGSQKAEAQEPFNVLGATGRVTIIEPSSIPNPAEAHNRAVACAKGEYVLLLDSNLMVVTPDWIESLLDFGIRSDVGAVGAKLLYLDQTIRHAGMILGVGDVAGYAHRYLSGTEPGYAERAISAHNVSAVTGECLLTRRDLFQKLGGLDATHLPSHFYDVDYCLRLQESGYLIVWTPYAILQHYEPAKSQREDQMSQIYRAGQEAGYMRRRWEHRIASDPYYSPNFSLATANFTPARYSRYYNVASPGNYYSNNASR